MPIEIRELVIKTTITDDYRRTSSSTIDTAQITKMKNEIVADCLEKVEKLLDRKKER